MVMGFGICNKVFGWTWKSEMRNVSGWLGLMGFSHARVVAGLDGV